MTARLPIDKAHRDATTDAHGIGAVTGLSRAISALERTGIACLGDSLTAGTSAGLQAGYNLIDYPTMLAALLRRPVFNAGVGGDSVEQMRDRLSTSVIAKNVAYCVLLAGTNNTSNTTTLASGIAAYGTILDTLMAAGITPVLCLLLPRNDDAGKLPQLRLFNRWIAQQAWARGLQLIDTYTPFANADGSANATYYDAGGLHLNQTGYDLLASTVSKVFTAETRGMLHGLPGETLVVANGNFTADANADGLADTFTAGAFSGTAPAKSLVAHPIAGNWQVITSDGTAGNRYLYWPMSAATLAANFAPGDVVDISVDVKTSADAAGGSISAQNNLYNASNAALWTGADSRLFAQYGRPLPDLVRFTKTMTIPAGADHWNFYFTNSHTSASAALYIGRFVIEKRRY